MNKTEIDNAIYLDVIMPRYNLIEYSNNCSKTSWGVIRCWYFSLF